MDSIRPEVARGKQASVQPTNSSGGAMTRTVARTEEPSAPANLAKILTAREPFGPRDAESLVDLGLAGTEELFDHRNCGRDPGAVQQRI